MRWAWSILLLAVTAAHGFQVRVTPTFDGRPLVFDQPSLTNAAGQVLSVTRLDFLLSDFALRRADGTWLEIPEQFMYVGGRDGTQKSTSSTIPDDSYSALRFHVGVPEKINHGDPAVWPAGHPLNPLVNGLHWSWQGGYVFMAVEGHWSGQRGYSFHLATDRQLAAVEVPLHLQADGVVELSLAVEKILGRITLKEGAESTHSREGDDIADRLRDNLADAFVVVRTESTETLKTEAAPAAMGGTPYRFSFSKYFPMPALPRDNPLTEEGVELGRRLFNDPRLSINNRQSCASCHKEADAFSDTINLSAGAEGHTGKRNTMPIFNLAWKSSFFWDGRATTLRDQAKGPMENPVEMHETVTNVAAKLAASGDYPEITKDRMLLALEQFMFAQVSCDSRFDRALNGEAELTEQEKRGFELFNTEYDPRRQQFGADCFHCHGGPLFQSQTFANNGLDAKFGDEGRFAATGRAGDRGKFAVPSLRNVALTAPYMHDGRFATLDEVIEHYVSGVQRSDTLDPNIAKHPDGGVPLADADKKAIVAFLKTLTEERLARKD